MSDDPLAGLTRRQLEELAGKITKALQSCVLCGREGSKAYRITDTSKNGFARASIDLCLHCFEKVRRRESLAAEPGS